MIWGRDGGKAGAHIARLAPYLPAVRIHREDSIEAAARSADVLITTTSPREPIIHGKWLRPGQHITAIGADDGTKCELDAACLTRAGRLVVDSREAARSYGDISRHMVSGAVSFDHIHGEIGEVLSGKQQGRTSPSEITVAKFIGLGVQDLAAAQVTLRILSRAGDI